MIANSLSLELDTVLKKVEKQELFDIWPEDPEISGLWVEERRRRDLLHIELGGSRKHGSAVPQSIRGFLSRNGIGYWPVRELRHAA